ncbi:esterase family protein [Propionibacteriaceae bacterium G1746]|uniref:esterase family protein n=1 Tax=Aestuariimicrobium sp. G57 TaxID=3418485 RepID=UPI003C2719E3
MTQVSYHREHSSSLGHDMEFKVYGHGGQPCLVFPTQNGRFYDYEDHGMVEALRPWLDAGRLQLFCLDSVDDWSWSDVDGDRQARMELQERYHRYVVNEMVPKARWWSGHESPPLWVMGNSMGGFHSAISFFRRPELFDVMVSLSGLFEGSYFMGYGPSGLAFDNSPADFVANMPDDHPWLGMYRHRRIISCVGQGAWEEELLASTRWMDAVLTAKGVPHEFEYWGHDVAHEWHWWHRMIRQVFERLMPW